MRLPQVSEPMRERLELEVRLPNGHRWTENEYDFYLLPASSPRRDLAINVMHDLDGLRDRLQHAGYQLKDSGEVMIAARVDHEVASYLEQGNSVILLIDSEDALPADWPVRAKVRVGTELDGRWFSNYNWIRPDRAPFSAVAFGRILGFESAEVAPRYILQGIAGADFDDVLSGITYGWLNQNSALAAQVEVGAGKLLLTTYRFDKYGADPYATNLLDAFVSYVCGEECQPHLRMPQIASATSP
jgi:hypothetical protein